MKVFVEVVEARPKLMIIGAGHVGKALATLADFLSFRVIVVDEREEFASAAVYPMAAEIYSDEEITLAIGQAQIDPDTYIAIATKDSDERCLRKVIGSGAAYIGMIGSGRKVLKVLQRLNADGVPEALTRAVNAPVGLDIGAETPEEIAVSIMAEILRVRNNATGKSLREVKLGAQE
jgi:xanthine dehydrogenase accessory factor